MGPRAVIDMVKENKLDVLKNLTGSFSFNGTDFIKTLRTAALVALCVGIVQGIDYVNLYDFGAMDNLISMCLVPIADGIRRWARDNSIPLREIKTTAGS